MVSIIHKRAHIGKLKTVFFAKPEARKCVQDFFMCGVVPHSTPPLLFVQVMQL